jgi:thermitase
MSSRTDILAVAAALAAVTALAAAPAGAAAPAVDRDAVARSVAGAYGGEAIVRFEPGVDAGGRLAARRAADVTLDRALGLPRAQVVAFDAGSVAAAVRRLERQPGVAYAQPNHRYRALAVDPPDDSFFGDLWGLGDTPAPDPGVNALAAWETTRGAGQTIAIVDTGVALDHPDLAGSLWTGPGGEHGWDFVDGDDDPDDFQFHGTHVAGTAAATAGNGIGIAGVAPEASVMAVRVLDGDGSGSTADIADGIDYASENGADVINLSLGGPPGVGDQLMGDAVARAGQRDAVVVAAAGNDGHDNDVTPTMPCALPQPNLICVAAVNRSGGRAGFSNYGATSVDVGAPGTAILSARADYDQIFAHGFESDLGAWSTFAAPGSALWEVTGAFSSAGGNSATDSAAGHYAPNSDSQLFTAAPLDLTGERGCRIHLDLRYDIEEPDDDGLLFDYLLVGGATDDPDVLDGRPFAGTSSGYADGAFRAEEVSISDLGGRDDVRPFLGLFSDESVERDGGYADELEVLCRRATYLDSKGAAGNYVAFQGTSMAAPHVAGVAALVRAADPGAPHTQVVAAIRDSGTPLPGLAGVTASGRAVDADAAIAAALGLENSPSPAPAPPSAPAPAPPPPVSRTVAPRGPAIPRLSSRRRIAVSPRRTFAYAFRATPGLKGRATVRLARRTAGLRRGTLLAARRFTVGRRGKVALRLRLAPARFRALRRAGRLPIALTVTVRDRAGRNASATGRATLAAPRP